MQPLENAVADEKLPDTTSLAVETTSPQAPDTALAATEEVPGAVGAPDTTLSAGTPAPTPSNTVEAPVVSSRFSAGTEDRSEEHTSELQSLMRISYAVFCLKKKN